MKALIFTFIATTILISATSMAQLSSTVIPNVSQNKLEKALRSQMDVHGVSIVEVKESKIFNRIGDIISRIDESAGQVKKYTLTMIVDESIFNSRQHLVKCEIADVLDRNALVVSRCESDTSSVGEMIISKKELQ